MSDEKASCSDHARALGALSPNRAASPIPSHALPARHVIESPHGVHKHSHADEGWTNGHISALRSLRHHNAHSRKLGT